eukprot:3940490-Rhodomonas_salina.2
MYASIGIGAYKGTLSPFVLKCHALTIQAMASTIGITSVRDQVKQAHWMGKERGDYSFYTMRFRMAVPLL